MRDLNGVRSLVVGLGKSGVAAAKLLARNGSIVRVADERSREQIAEAAQVLDSLNIPLVPQVPDVFQGVDLVVLSPGVATDIPGLQQARASGIEVIGEVELAGYFLKGPIVGVTGSNGKTTSTAMIGHILRENGIPCQVGGNIGVAPTAMIDGSRDDQWNVLELSSFQLETIETFNCKIGVCVNVTPDHLDRHHTFENYVAAKGRLFQTQTAEDFAVLNGDDPVVAGYANLTKGQVYWFSRKKAVDRGISLSGSNLTYNGVPLLALEDIPLRGMHNVENTMASVQAAMLAGAPHSGIRQAVRTFPGVEHRLEFVRERNGVNYYNDSKATNVDATEKAIDAFPGNLWIILGGKDKNSDYTVLYDKLEAKTKGILLIGAAADKIAGQLHGLDMRSCGTLDNAVAFASQQATAGDTVLLAPACASFDQFQSYEHRGRVFKNLVKGL